MFLCQTCEHLCSHTDLHILPNSINYKLQPATSYTSDPVITEAEQLLQLINLKSPRLLSWATLNCIWWSSARRPRCIGGSCSSWGRMGDRSLPPLSFIHSSLCLEQVKTCVWLVCIAAREENFHQSFQFDPESKQRLDETACRNANGAPPASCSV